MQQAPCSSLVTFSAQTAEPLCKAEATPTFQHEEPFIGHKSAAHLKRLPCASAGRIPRHQRRSSTRCQPTCTAVAAAAATPSALLAAVTRQGATLSRAAATADTAPATTATATAATAAAVGPAAAGHRSRPGSKIRSRSRHHRRQLQAFTHQRVLPERKALVTWKPPKPPLPICEPQPFLQRRWKPLRQRPQPKPGPDYIRSRSAWRLCIQKTLPALQQ